MSPVLSASRGSNQNSALPVNDALPETSGTTASWGPNVTRSNRPHLHRRPQDALDRNRLAESHISPSDM